MASETAPPVLRLRGVRHNNLKGFDLDLPLRRLIVVTGLSGSGKSSLAFDTLFAEGQRRYIETFSPYARQFLDRMDKPQVDSIEGIPPAVAIEQRNTVRTTRSTVGTMTEICDYMKVVWPHVSQLFCRQCGRRVRKDTPELVWRETKDIDSEVLVTFDLPLSDRLSLEDSLALVTRQGYQRVLAGDQALRIEESVALLREQKPGSLTIIQDRLRPTPAQRSRFVEACEQAYHFGKGRLAIRPLSPGADAASQPLAARPSSARLHCAVCDLEYHEPSPALFSFNHPLGACPTCRGFGRTITIDYGLVMPDLSRTLAEGVVRPWQTGLSAECQQDMLTFCRQRQVPTDVPFEQLPPRTREWVINGDPGYGTDPEHEWPRAWYGVKGYFRWLEGRTYKMHVRVLLSRYRSYQPCPDCRGQRLRPEALLYRCLPPDARGDDNRAQTVAGMGVTLAGFYQLSIRDALRFVQELVRRGAASDPRNIALDEVRARLTYLDQVGLGYLTLDRPTRTLSGGETERVNLTTCLGTRLVNTLFVLDEPSVGLHPRDTERLVRLLLQLRDAGNTVVVVEHEASVIRAADQVVDLGPGHGEQGGSLVFQGGFSRLLRCSRSLTGQYLSGRKQVVTPTRRAVDRLAADRAIAGAPSEAAGPAHTASTAGDAPHFLTLSRVSRHNLRDLDVAFPLRRFVCVTGVSGSGKTTLVREVLLPLLEKKLLTADRSVAAPGGSMAGAGDDESPADSEAQTSAQVTGWESLERVVMVDQSSLGKTPRSTPAVYVGAFDDIRDVFARSSAAIQQGLPPGIFSFNSRFGQCERCRGVGFEKIEMQFLSDVYIRCPACDGRRYRPHLLDIQIAPPPSAASGNRERHPWSIADMLEATVDQAIEFLRGFEGSPHALRAVAKLQLIAEIGLGYLRLGQPINTLSGGESQRLKLVAHLAEAGACTRQPIEAGRGPARKGGSRLKPETDPKPTLFLFDEPTTGLHFDDVRVLLGVFQRLVDEGHSLLVIEHNLDVIKCADWVVDLGPEAAEAGGRLVAHGTPENVASCISSHTGQALRKVLCA